MITGFQIGKIESFASADDIAILQQLIECCNKFWREKSLTSRIKSDTSRSFEFHSEVVCSS